MVFVSSFLLVNALEWLGERLRLGSSFVGAILSPLFTSLPELIIILIAILSGVSATGSEIGIGTIFGEPFMVSSLSYGLLGMAAIVSYSITRKRAIPDLAVHKTLAIPFATMIILFPLTLIPGFVRPGPVRYVFGVFFLAAFIVYVYLMYRRKASELIDESDELIIGRRLPKSPAYQNAAVVVQSLAAIALLYFGSRYLVSSVAMLATDINVSALGLAMLVVPAATALPETIAALIWTHRGKDTLAVGSLVGEKVLYCTFYPGLGLFLTSWNLDVHAVFSVGATTAVSVVMLYFILKQRLPRLVLMTGFVAFVAYAIIVLGFRI